MKISYLILAHKNPVQFQRLINKLNAKNVYFFIHVDKTTDDDAFKKPFLNSINIFFIENKQRMITPWSDIAICKVTLLLLKEAINKCNSHNYCVLLSGQDYPIKNNKYIYNFYSSNYGQNYITVKDIVDIWPAWQNRLERYNFHLPNKRLNKGVFSICDNRFFTIRNFKHIFYLIKTIGLIPTIKAIFKRKRTHPDYLVPKGGDTWWALPVETAIDIIDYLRQHPDLLTYHSYTHVPDETLFASIINKIKEKQQIKATNTYTNWVRQDVDLPVTFYRDDLQELLHAGDNYLFARKFDITQDSDILDNLDKHMNSYRVNVDL